MPEGERDTLMEFRNNTQGVATMLTEIRKRSDKLSADDIATPLDLVFLDGDHDYSCVKDDFTRVSLWITPTGTIAFHDCLSYVGVSRVIGEALASGEWKVAGQENNLFWIRHATFDK